MRGICLLATVLVAFLVAPSLAAECTATPGKSAPFRYQCRANNSKKCDCPNGLRCQAFRGSGIVIGSTSNTYCLGDVCTDHTRIGDKTYCRLNGVDVCTCQPPATCGSGANAWCSEPQSCFVDGAWYFEIDDENEVNYSSQAACLAACNANSACLAAVWNADENLCFHPINVRNIVCGGFPYDGINFFVKCSALPASDGTSTCPYDIRR